MNLQNRDGYQSIYDNEGNVVANGARSNKRLDLINWSLFKDRTVLDIGCNNGMLAIKAAESGAKKVTGIERSNAAHMAIELSRQKGLTNINIYQADIEDYKLIYTFKPFNIIFFCAMLNHMRDKIKIMHFIDKLCNGILIYETNFENSPQKHIDFVQKHTSFEDPCKIIPSGDRKPEDYTLIIFTRNSQEMWGKHENIPIEDIPLKKIKLGIDSIDAYKGQEKYETERKKLDNLKDNILRNGLISPIWVKRKSKKSKHYHVIEGGHRFLAYKDLELPSIPARIISDGE